MNIRDSSIVARFGKVIAQNLENPIVFHNLKLCYCRNDIKKTFETSSFKDIFKFDNFMIPSIKDSHLDLVTSKQPLEYVHLSHSKMSLFSNKLSSGTGSYVDKNHDYLGKIS